MCDPSWARRPAAFCSSLKCAVGEIRDHGEVRHGHGSHQRAAFVHRGASALKPHTHLSLPTSLVKHAYLWGQLRIVAEIMEKGKGLWVGTVREGFLEEGSELGFEV